MNTTSTATSLANNHGAATNPGSYIAVAAEWNSHGATLLAQSQVGAALQSFRRALDILASVTAQQQEPPATTSRTGTQVLMASLPVRGSSSSSPTHTKSSTARQANDSSSNSSSSTTCTSTSTNHQEEDQVPMMVLQEDSKDDDGMELPDHFVYTEALVFDARSAAAAPSYLPLYCAVVEFNLGLSYQLLPTKKHSERAHQTALRLYDQCLEHIQQALIRPNLATGTNEYANIIVAAMNNQAILLYEWAFYDRVRAMFQSLMELMLASDDGRALPGFTPEHVQGILLNVLLMRGNKLAPAA